MSNDKGGASAPPDGHWPHGTYLTAKTIEALDISRSLGLRQICKRLDAAGHTAAPSVVRAAIRWMELSDFIETRHAATWPSFDTIRSSAWWAGWRAGHWREYADDKQDRLRGWESTYDPGDRYCEGGSCYGLWESDDRVADRAWAASDPDAPQRELTRREQYHEYLRSHEWNEKRQRALARAGHRCQLCSSTTRLNVHHNTYERLYREEPVDLCVLCRDCHRKFHDL